MSRYGVKEIFSTLQGEGHRAGSKAVFIRFTGCNMWDGMPLHRDRGAGACAKWCDTDFFKGKPLTTDDIIASAGDAWAGHGERWCVLTGGEPCLQVDAELIHALHGHGWRVAIETNGTVDNPHVERHADWICIAPKLALDGKPTNLVLKRAEEIKVVLPGVASGEGWTAEDLHALARQYPNAHHFVQPMDPIVHSDLIEETALRRTVDMHADEAEDLEARLNRNVKRCVTWVMQNPSWRTSLQTHKILGLQ